MLRILLSAPLFIIASTAFAAEPASDLKSDTPAISQTAAAAAAAPAAPAAVEKVKTSAGAATDTVAAPVPTPELVIVPFSGRGKRRLKKKIWKKSVGAAAVWDAPEFGTNWIGENRKQVLRKRKALARCRLDPDCISDIAMDWDVKYVIAGRIAKRSVKVRVIDTDRAEVVYEGEAKKKGRRRTRSLNAAQSAVEGALAALQSKLVAAREAREAAVLAANPPEPEVLPVTELFVTAKNAEHLRSVKVDGAFVLPEADGSIRFTGAPGTHHLEAVRVDGEAVKAAVELAADEKKDYNFQFLTPYVPVTAPAPALALAPPPAVEEEDDDDGAGWILWVGIGAALLGGGAAAYVLSQNGDDPATGPGTTPPTTGGSNPAATGFVAGDF